MQAGRTPVAVMQAAKQDGKEEEKKDGRNEGKSAGKKEDRKDGKKDVAVRRICHRNVPVRMTEIPRAENPEFFHPSPMITAAAVVITETQYKKNRSGFPAGLSMVRRQAHIFIPILFLPRVYCYSEVTITQTYSYSDFTSFQ